MTASVKRASKGRFHTNDSTRKSMLDILGGFYNNRERYNWMWNAATKSAMLTKKLAKGKDGKTVKKYNIAGNLIVKTARMSRTHGYKVLLSGASAEAYRIMLGEAYALRRKADQESTYCPVMPTISDGALLNLEQVCVAICQTYFGRAVGLKKAMPLSEKEKEEKVEKKVTGKMQEIACAAVNETLCAVTGLWPGTIRMESIVKKTKLSEKQVQAVKERKSKSKLEKELRRKKELVSSEADAVVDDVSVEE